MVRHATLIGLLAVTGMRPGEAVGLDRHDVDLNTGVVQIRAGKQKKQREVSLHATAISAATWYYARLRGACPREPSTPALFVSARGQRMGREELNRTFTNLVCEVGLDGSGARTRPRPMTSDMRLPCTLLGWYRDGENLDRRMPLCSPGSVT